MIIDLRTYKQNGISNGEFSFKFTPQNALALPYAEIENGVVISGGFETIGSDVFVKGAISFTVTGACSRCLSPAKSNVLLEFNEKFIINKDDAFYRYSKDKVDLTELAENLFVTDCPSCIYCKTDCKGICPSCGKNLNNESCTCTNN